MVGNPPFLFCFGCVVQKTGDTFLPYVCLKPEGALAIIKLVIEMLYVCDNCGLLFSRTGEQEQCPDCGKHMVRSANAVEQHKFASRMAELIRCVRSEEPRFPNLVETEISMLDVFTFKLPATALQIDSEMMVDVIVNYGESSADRGELIANVWAKRADGVTVCFLMPIHLPARPGETPKERINRIFATLNENGTFKVKLFDFVAEQLGGRV